MNISPAISWGHILNIQQSLVTRHYHSFTPNTVVMSPSSAPIVSKLLLVLYILYTHTVLLTSVLVLRVLNIVEGSL